MLESRTVTLRKNAPMDPGNGFARACLHSVLALDGAGLLRRHSRDRDATAIRVAVADVPAAPADAVLDTVGSALLQRSCLLQQGFLRVDQHSASLPAFGRCTWTAVDARPWLR